MGTRGPLRQPDSVRGLRSGVTDMFDQPEPVTAPTWLSKPAKKEFKTLVKTLTQAQVPIKAADSYSLAMAAQCITAVAEWSVKEQESQSLREKIDCSKLVARYQRDSQKWLETLCATPAARARIGMRQTAKKKGPVAQLLELKRNGR